MRLDHLAGESFMEKALPLSYVFSLCGVVVKCSPVGPKVPGSSPTQLSFFPSFFFGFSVFCVVVFYKYIHK